MATGPDAARGAAQDPSRGPDPQGAARDPGAGASRPAGPPSQGAGGLNVVLGVCGGIAAYKAVHLARSFTEAGHHLRVVPTDTALHFVGRATWEAISGRPAPTDPFENPAEVDHVALGRWADLLVVAPATADLLARAATGRAEDLLCATLLTVRCPVLLAPAMHTEMWTHPATVANVATLRERGVHVMDPDSGRLTGTDSGPGRLPEPSDIARVALALTRPGTPAASPTPPALSTPPSPPRGDLSGLRLVITAGGTREAVDPVRYLGNRSSGRQGVAIAEAARDRGARVELVAAAVSVPLPEGVHVTRVESAEQMRRAVAAAWSGADAVVMCAAVADFRPERAAVAKIKKTPQTEGLTLRLVPNPDILAEMVARRGGGAHPVLVGFAAETGDETGDVLDHGRAKARRKGADLLAVNRVGAGAGFAVPDNAVTVLDPSGQVVGRAEGTKRQVADALLDLVARRLPPPRT